MFTGPYGVSEPGTWQERLLVRPEHLTPVPDAIEDTAGGGVLIVGGSVKSMIDRVYPFDEAGEALRHLIEDRPSGMVVLTEESIGVES
jgi:hypothetical protein